MLGRGKHQMAQTAVVEVNDWEDNPGGGASFATVKHPAE